MNWRRLAIAALLGMLGSLAVLCQPARAQCPVPDNLPPLRLNVQVASPRVTYHHDVDLFGLPKLEHHSERPPPGWVLLGLTKLSDQLRLAFQWVTLPLGDGRQCVWLTAIDAQLGDPVMNVYVASEYPPESCEYNVVFNHENTHVRFNIETLRDWMPSVKAALVEAGKRKFPVIYATPPTVEDLRHYLLDNMTNVFDLMSADLRKRNASIDTPENYRREHAKCHDWSRHGMQLDK